MNVESMDQSLRETKVKYETELANLREQVTVRILSDTASNCSVNSHRHHHHHSDKINVV